MVRRTMTIWIPTLLAALALAGITMAPGAMASGEGDRGLPADLPIYTEWKSYTVEDGLPSKKATYVLADGDALWVGTEKGLARLEDGSWKVFSVDDGLAYPVVSSLAICGKTGDLWIGTFGGLSRFSAGRFDSFNQLNSGLINDVIYSVDVIEGKVWSATAAGVSIYDPDKKSWALFNNENTVMHEPWCYSLTSSPEHVYVAVWGGGVLEHDPVKETWKAYRDPDGEMEIDLFRDDGLVHDVTSGVSYGDGILWVATYFGLSRYNGRSWRSYLEHDTGLPSNFVNVVHARGKWGWIGTDYGLAAFDGERWVVYRRDEEGSGGSIEVTGGDGKTEKIATLSAIAHNYVLWVHPQEDRVWVATSAGLSVGTRRTSGPEEKGAKAPVKEGSKKE